jgi:methyl-accepting chemotaxis protein
MAFFRRINNLKLKTAIENPPVTEVVAPVVEAPKQSGDETARFRASIDIIEQDVQSALTRLEARIASSRAMTTDTSEALGRIHGGMLSLRDSAEATNRNIGELAQAAEEVSVNVEDVSRNVEATRERMASAATEAGAANAIIEELSAAAREINGIIDTIAKIASQTNLLALNATIEAARAGEAGRGFAVVAQEVKSLSVETSKRVDEIRKRVTVLDNATARSVEAISGVSRLVGDVSPMVNAISEAMREQASSSVELSRRAQDAARFVELVTARVAEIDAEASSATTRSNEAANEAERAATDAASLSRRFVPVIRQSSFADRREHDRFPAEISLRFRMAGRDWTSATVDISQRGLLIAPPQGLQARAGDDIRIVLDGVGEVQAHVVGVSPLGLHCRIETTKGASFDAFQGKVEEVQAGYQPLIDRAQAVAAEIVTAMSALIEKRRLTEAQLFDTTYTPVPESDPQQFETPSLPALRDILPAICEPPLVSDKRLVFCLAIDRNGYIPVHNRVYSQPQRKGDPVWNAANCRDRRIFDDRAGIIAARSTRPFVVQSYRRDMGGGNFVIMREVDAPIIVRDRQWGGVRMAYRF